MSIENPPTENTEDFNNGLDFNPNFYNNDGPISEVTSDNRYLRKKIQDTATALQTFAAGISTNNIKSLSDLSLLSFEPLTSIITFDKPVAAALINTTTLSTNILSRSNQVSNVDIFKTSSPSGFGINFQTSPTEAYATGFLKIGQPESKISALAGTFTSNHTIATTSNDQTVCTTAFSNQSIAGGLNSLRGNANTFTNVNTFSNSIKTDLIKSVNDSNLISFNNTDSNITLGSSSSNVIIPLLSAGDGSTAIKQTAGDNSTKIATTSFVSSAVTTGTNAVYTALTESSNTFIAQQTFSAGIKITAPTTLNYDLAPTVGQVGYILEQISFAASLSPVGIAQLAKLDLTPGVWALSWCIRFVTSIVPVGLLQCNIKYDPNRNVDFYPCIPYPNNNSLYVCMNSCITSTRVSYQAFINVLRGGSDANNLTISQINGYLRAVRIA